MKGSCTNPKENFRLRNKEYHQELNVCPNCKEITGNCACMRNKCLNCGESVGNITFTFCDNCLGKKKERLIKLLDLK